MSVRSERLDMPEIISRVEAGHAVVGLYSPPVVVGGGLQHRHQRVHVKADLEQRKHQNLYQ